MTMRYKPARGDDASLRERMKAIAQERRRFAHTRVALKTLREVESPLFLLTPPPL